jgi:DNA replication protein DnaC
MSETDLLLKSHLKTLKLPVMRQEYAAVARRCSQANVGYESFLAQLAELEVQNRLAQAIARRLKLSCFPAVKELADFDFTAVPRLNKKLVLDLSRGEFIERKFNVVLTGAPGVGKTHLAIALGREACRRGFQVRFFTASDLVNTYVEARQERQILKLEKQLRYWDLVIVDELGYLPLDRIGAEHLFGFFSQCYERTSLIVTTNLPFAEWPKVMADDERLAGALLDRLTHHVQVLELTGESYRLKASLSGPSAAKGGEAPAP